MAWKTESKGMEQIYPNTNTWKLLAIVSDGIKLKMKKVNARY